MVESHVRWGVRVAAPLGEKGRIDYLVAFEMLESARSIDYLKPGGVAVVNRQRILPMSAVAADASYPTEEAINDQLRTVTDRVIYVNGLEIATKLGNKNLANSVMLGALAHGVGVETGIWLDVLIKRVPPKYVEANKKAFLEGRTSFDRGTDPKDMGSGG